MKRVSHSIVKIIVVVGIPSDSRLWNFTVLPLVIAPVLWESITQQTTGFICRHDEALKACLNWDAE